ncbi:MULTISPECIES: nucleotidyltransferase substrate binding protein [unclassified Bifidobacterium]|uniref:nucleotidyltransferase substrate binding protein n=1 Tax=unclassified Bifidobacterium TaxID=2608897 RepID=UPI001129BE78|nr:MULTISPECIES: nucleotidyltransferase substrate binding protein [unclassified Bifidobacterium]TPF78530.1 nucleotidyltransferase [Bifidobacterium sp. UTCIF-1]TPF80810.1 nucleotidyltransferase [Bifidobacterium sp. UTCIF-24]TPF82750.1 nucleotidyltransferase [Bifidobacterium sp. UTCIF-3]TPF84477.1 nucleotidyltransferase [Bifidobacterium sp. UTCIF-36]TPF90963.1 nucleotidyltransferase [Bifidobacterium sp. UTBIF-56]
MKKYENYASALDSLKPAPLQDLSNDFIQSGIIDKFELQFELGWKLLKALLAYEGDPVSASGSPRDVIKTAYQYYDFMDESLWLRMLRDRNDSAHIYDEDRAQRLVHTIIDSYIPEFERVDNGLTERYGTMLTE